MSHPSGFAVTTPVVAAADVRVPNWRTRTNAAKNRVDSRQYGCPSTTYTRTQKSGIRECAVADSGIRTHALGAWTAPARERPCWIQYQHSLHSPRVFCSGGDTYFMGHPASEIAHVRVIRAPPHDRSLWQEMENMAQLRLNRTDNAFLHSLPVFAYLLI